MISEFTPEEKRIINVLYSAHKPLTTLDISDRSEMAWQTAKKYLKKLCDLGYVTNGKYGKSVYWWLKV
jgi:Mn-dependent DtxR family transcriptional regulator